MITAANFILAEDAVRKPRFVLAEDDTHGHFPGEFGYAEHTPRGVPDKKEHFAKKHIDNMSKEERGKAIEHALYHLKHGDMSEKFNAQARAFLNAAHDKNYLSAKQLDKTAVLMTQGKLLLNAAKSSVAPTEPVMVNAATPSTGHAIPAAPMTTTVAAAENAKYFGGKKMPEMSPAEIQENIAKALFHAQHPESMNYESAQKFLASADNKGLLTGAPKEKYQKLLSAKTATGELLPAPKEKYQKLLSAKTATGELLPTHQELSKITGIALSPEHIEAIKAYTGSEYRYMSHALREGKSVEALPVTTAAHVRLLDHVLEHAELKNDTELYRGIKIKSAQRIFGDEIKQGMVVHDKGFVSTSTRENVAKEFSELHGVILHIMAPKGAKALNIRQWSSHPGESEVLVPRGAKFRVDSVMTPKVGDKHLHVRLSYVS